MSKKEPWNRAVEDNHLDLVVSFNRGDGLVELWN